VSIEAGWRPDPTLDGRLRYWDGKAWTAHVSSGGEQYDEPFLGPNQTRFQFGVVNIGAYGAMQRMASVLAAAGEAGWELITIYDKSSNWFAEMEKGFMLFKRPVPAGTRLRDDEWCVTIQF
jgi:hypothetical protein